MKKFAVFDIDGTLIRWQLYHAVVDKLAKQGALGEDATEIIHEARMKWKRREDEGGFSAYEKTLIAYYEQAITKLDPKQFDQVALQVIDEFKDQVYTYTRDLIATLKSQSYMILAISGSQKELIEHIAKHYGFDDYIATEYSRTDDSFSGEVFVGSHNKNSALQKLIQKHGLTYQDSYAVGDSKSDAAMLELAENPIAFNPDRSLFEIAKNKSWKIVIERKNMIYELEKKDGHYILA